jgi:hypothetical protein
MSDHKKKLAANQKFEKIIRDIIPVFEKAREWGDLVNCLQKINLAIETNIGLRVPAKQELAKRLSQCLNPDFTMIH